MHLKEPSTCVRPPAVAGLFYPSEPNQLATMIDDFIAAVSAPLAKPKAVIAPHAGYIYSGPVAASAYAHLKALAGIVRRVVLLGPSHRIGFSGLATTASNAYVTPLGEVALDRVSIDTITALRGVSEMDAAHAREHSLEVHLPFLQRVLGTFTLVPLVVGEAADEDVAGVLNNLWGGPETLIVISSDLSHYHDFATARALDAHTSRAIEALNPMAIAYDHACGRYPIAGLLRAARDHGLTANTVDLRNSGDTAGPRDRVVGYGAYVFT